MFQSEFREDLRYWVETDRKIAFRAFDLIEAILRDPFIGICKPEPHLGKTGKYFLKHLSDANSNANPDLMRLALKLATGAGHLPNNLTIERIREGISNIRNPILVSFVAKGLLPYHGLGSGGKRFVSFFTVIKFNPLESLFACTLLTTIDWIRRLQI